MIKVTFNLTENDQAGLKAFVDRQMKIHNSIADSYEAEGKLGAAEIWRKELTLEQWAYRAFLDAIMPK